MSVGFGTISYDSSKLSANQVPSTFELLGDPAWNGKLILTYPNDDDAIAYLFSLIVSRYGQSWLRAVASNNVQWVRGTGTPAFELVRQHNDTTSKRALSFTTGSSAESWFETKAVEAPEQIMAWPQTGAILAGTPQPETAKLFMAWVTGPEHQSSAGNRTVLKSLNAANRVDLYSSNTTDFSGFRVFEAA